MTEQKDGLKPSTRFAGISQQQEAIKQDYKTLGRKPPDMPLAPAAPPPGPSGVAPTKRKQYAIYLSPATMRRIKHRIADTEEEISEVVEKALLSFLESEGQ